MYSRDANKRAREKKQAIPIPDGFFLCTTCRKYCPCEAVGKTKQGDDAKSCDVCLSNMDVRDEARKTHVREMIVERILHIGYSCFELREIHLKERPESPLGIQRLRVINEIVTYEGIEYRHLDFVQKFKDQLELQHLQLDHLPQDEYVKLYPNGTWVAKHDLVSCVKTKVGRVMEMAKCQLVCGLGHVMATARRIEQKHQLAGTTKQNLSPFNLAKQTWTDNYKREKRCRCEHCGGEHINEPLSFTHFDHIDVNAKANTISNMIKDTRVSLEQIQEEVKTKCRLLCMHCHAIHTGEQYESGIIQKKSYDTKKRRIQDAIVKSDEMR